VFLDRLAENENTPPLIYLVLMLMPGTEPAWLRVPAAVPGVLACVVPSWPCARASAIAALCWPRSPSPSLPTW
jgi:hypothetical protein